MSTTELIELINKLPSEKQKEVEEFIGSLIADTNSQLHKSFKNGIKPGFGGGKGIISYISDDFDEPLDEFKDYM
jgi:Protein of unknown function (DUF2281)